MKTLILSCVLALTISSVGCGKDSPQTISSGAHSSKLIPEPILVPYSAIPHPRPNNLYRVSGAALPADPTEILERVLEAGFDMQRAWHPQIALCMALFLDELIVELKEPNDEIYKLGFTSDFTGTSGPCTSHWNEYDFVPNE